MTKCIGVLKVDWGKLIGLHLDTDWPIMLGESNLLHMQTAHPDDYLRYSQFIELIVQAADYIGLHPKDNSIELVKEFCIDNKYVKLALRTSAAGTLFARSLYTLNNNRVQNFIKKGTLVPIDKQA